MPATRCSALPLLLCALLLGHLLWCPPALAGGLHIMTEQYPPFSYQVEGEARGFCVEIVQRILERLGLGGTEIVFYPWARAYMKLKDEDDHVLFPMVRSVGRAGLFRFVGPVFEDTLYFYRRKGSAVVVQGLADARRVAAIGVTRDDFYHQFLVKRGFTNLDVSANQIHDFRKLAQGRVDLVPMGERAMSGFIGRQQGLDPAMFEKTGPAISSSEVFIGFSGSTSDAVVESWQKALDELKEAGVFLAIMNRYFPTPDSARP
jgi:polar amino acid transport system substrate-binding protein